MITRVVKLTIQESHIQDFQKIFDKKMRLIKNQPGCHQLQLYRSEKNCNVFFTISKWENEKALDAYRSSSLFGEIWPVVKTYFADRPEAYSLQLEIDVE